MLLSGVARPSEAAPQGLRGRKRLQTEEALVDAALRLFAGQGYDNTTIDQITAEVDISRRTFFRYFASKEDVLFVDYHVEPILSEVRAQPLSVSDFDAVRDAWLAKLPRLDRRPRFWRRRRSNRALLFEGAINSDNPRSHDAVAAALAYRRGLPYADKRRQRWQRPWLKRSFTLPTTTGLPTVGALTLARRSRSISR